MADAVTEMVLGILGAGVLFWVGLLVAVVVFRIMFIRTFFRMAKSLERIHLSIEGGQGERSIREALVISLEENVPVQDQLPAARVLPTRPNWPSRAYSPKTPEEARTAIQVLHDHIDSLERLGMA